MTNLMEYLKEQDFSSGVPEGDTFIDIAGTTAEKTEGKDPTTGKPTVRHKLSTSDGKIYMVGVTIMRGIQKASADGFTKVRITRQGTGMASKYTITPIAK